MAKEESKRLRFIIHNKTDNSLICGVRYDARENEFLVGGPKAKEDERKELINMLDLIPEEIEKEIKEDGFRFRLRVGMNDQMWRDFVRRVSRLYIFEEVKNFK